MKEGERSGRIIECQKLRRRCFAEIWIASTSRLSSSRKYFQHTLKTDLVAILHDAIA